VIRTPTTRDYLAISIFYLAVSFFWGAMLTVVLQARVQTLVEADYVAAIKAGAMSQQQLEAAVAQKLSWLLSMGALVATVSQVLFGALSDRSRHRAGRRKPFLIAGVLGTNVGLLLFPFAQTYTQLFAVFLLLQLLLNLATGPYQALVPDLIPAQYHGRAAAYMGLFALIGRTGGMVIGGMALLYLKENALYALSAAFFLLLNGFMIVTASLTREDPLPAEASTRESFTDALHATFQVDLRGQASFVWVLMSRFVINTGVYTIMPFMLYYLINVYSLTRDEAFGRQIQIAMLVNLTGLLATWPAGMASDRFSKKRVIYFTCAICIAGGLGFAFSGSIIAAIVAAGIFGFGYGAFMAVDMALVCNVLPEGAPAKYMGIWSFADTVPQIIAPFIGGAVAAWTIANYNSSALGYRAVMLTAIVWFMLGTLCIGFVRERVFPQPVETVPEEGRSTAESAEAV
jgi:MFS family permease